MHDFLSWKPMPKCVEMKVIFQTKMNSNIFCSCVSLISEQRNSRIQFFVTFYVTVLNSRFAIDMLCSNSCKLINTFINFFLTIFFSLPASPNSSARTNNLINTDYKQPLRIFDFLRNSRFYISYYWFSTNSLIFVIHGSFVLIFNINNGHVFNQTFQFCKNT